MKRDKIFAQLLEDTNMVKNNHKPYEEIKSDIENFLN
jgi:hypothetical protein